VRPFLPPLLAGALARADAGIDFSGTDYAFLESVPFLLAVVALAAVVTIGARGIAGRAPAYGLAAIAVVVGALEFAGSLAAEGETAAPGIAAGALIAVVGFAASFSFFTRAGARLASRQGAQGAAAEASPDSFMVLFADAAAVVIAAVAIFLSPLSLLPLVFCLWLLVEQRRRAGRKYEGLRVLR
jgi:hypothetical protein